MGSHWNSGTLSKNKRAFHAEWLKAARQLAKKQVRKTNPMIPDGDHDNSH